MKALREKTDVTGMILVGQTPPPFHGQALGIKAIADYPFERLRVHLVRMAFSDALASVGHFRWRKIVHLVPLAFRIALARWKTGAPVLYYPPAGPNWVPVLRDLFLLPLVRPWFAVTVFHFRAAGLAEWLEKRGWLVRLLARRAYGGVDLAIHMSQRLAADGGGFLQAQRTAVVPNGVADLAGDARALAGSGPGRILFVGALRPEKGVDALIEAARQLRADGIPFALELVGKAVSREYEQALKTQITNEGLESWVTLHGELTGEALRETYAAADIFCLPSRYAAEAMPRVIIEAMQFGLPVVATRWRGIPDMIEHGTQGLLVPAAARTSSALSEALEMLLRDRDTCRQMGNAARLRYEVQFTISAHMHALEAAVLLAVEGNRL